MDTTTSAVRVVEAWQHRDQQTGRTPAPVITNTRGAALVIEAAASCMLPLPADVTISAACVELVFDTLVELTEWSRWLGTPIATEIIDLGPFGSHAHHNIETDLYDIPVRFSTASELPR